MLHVVNRNQLRILKDVVVDKPLLLVQHGVDEILFDRSKYQKKKNDRLVISVSGRGSSNKGFETIQKACEATGCIPIGAKYGNKKLTKEQMPEFYNMADVHVCFSKSEGLSNPILEAGAMGIPVISTRSGAAEEMIRDGISGLLIDRDLNSLTTALNKLKDEKTRLDMGNEFHKEIMNNWTWKKKIQGFKEMFDLFFELRG